MNEKNKIKLTRCSILLAFERMTVDFLLANLYFYSVADNEGMAGLLASSFMALAAHPGSREWVREEVNRTLLRASRIRFIHPF